VNASPASSPDPEPAAPSPDSVLVSVSTSPPRLAFLLLGLTILVYLSQIVSDLLLGFDLPLWLGAKSSDLIRQGQLWRLLTPILLHGSVAHIAFNMYALFNLGPSLEQRFGSWRFLALYLLAGFSGNVFSFLFTDGLSVGASTSIFGLLAAEGIFLYRNRRLFGEHARQFIGHAVLIAAINLLLGVTSGGRIDNWGHIGGLLGGMIFAWFAGPSWDVEGAPPHLRLVDRRTFGQVILAAAIVLVLFGALFLLGWSGLLP